MSHQPKNRKDAEPEQENGGELSSAFEHDDEQEPWFKVGDKLGSYVVVEVMSRGTFSWNLKVEDLAGTQDHVIVHRRDDISPEATLRGIRFEKQLNLDGLARIVQIGEASPQSHGRFWFARELLPPPLGVQVRKDRQPLPPHEVLEVGLGACKVFEDLHRRPSAFDPSRPLVHGFLIAGYIHRTDKGDIKLGGMDVQVLIRSGVRVPERHLACRAPEFLHSSVEDLTPANDLWALAASLLYLATGEGAVDSDSREQIERDLSHHVPLRRAEGVSDPRLRRILVRALDPDPDRRYPTAAEFRQAMEEAMRSADEWFHPGDRLGPYTVERVISRSCFSYNLVVTDAEKQQFFAGVHLADDPSPQAVLDGLAKLKSLHHPFLMETRHIAEPSAESHGRVWLVRPFLPQSLGALVRDSGHPLPADEVLRIGRDLCELFVYLHDPAQHGGEPLVHGFLTPGYIFLTEGGTLQVVGMDIKLLLRASSDVPLRHQYYRSPECLTAPVSRLTPQNDLWAVAVCMCYFARGMHPTDADSLEKIRRAHREGRPQRVAATLDDPRLRRVLMKALASDATSRYQTAAEFRDALEEAMSESTHGAAPTRLRYAVENKFPHPIARAFTLVRGGDLSAASLLAMRGVWDATIRHLAIVALADCLSRGAADEQLRESLLKTFHRRPPTDGVFVGVLRDCLTASKMSAEPSFVPELDDNYFPQPGTPRLATIEGLCNELVRLRNDLFHKNVVRALPELSRQFKRLLLDLLQAILFLQDYPLVSAEHNWMESDIRTHKCVFLVGSRDPLETIDVQCDQDLEKSRVAMLSPRHHGLLYFSPLYVLRDCAGCGRVHLYRLSHYESKYAEYIPPSGDEAEETHRLRDKNARVELQAMFGDARPTLRRQTRYLHLSTGEDWTRRLPGECIGAVYRIVEHLRRGGMADVYLVERTDTGQQLALKLLPFQFLRDMTMVSRFRQQAIHSLALNHPHVVQVVDRGEDGADHYLVMELATGRLHNDRRIRDVGELSKPLPVAECLEIVRQACEGLDYIHQQQIIHRDIKPGNLLLFEEMVKVADFGIARWRDSISLTMTGLAMGTPEYMSPEQAEGTRDLTRASDVYSMGVLLYELLTGKSPFRRAMPLASLLAHLNQTPEPVRIHNPDIPPSLEKILARCLHKDPRRRFQTARKLLAALAHV